MGILEDLLAQYGTPTGPQAPAPQLPATFLPALYRPTPDATFPHLPANAQAQSSVGLPIPQPDPWIWLSPDGSVSYTGRQDAQPSSAPASNNNPLSANAMTLMALGGGIAQGGIGKGLQLATTAAEADRKMQVQRYMPPRRRFSPPWNPRRVPGGFEVRDARGQRLVWIKAIDDEFSARNAGILTIDEARRIATGIARLPELMQRPKVTRDELREYKEYFSVAIHVQGPLGPGEEVARLNSGTIGLKVFDAFVRAFPGCTLTMSNGTHRLRVHEPKDDTPPSPKDPKTS